MRLTTPSLVALASALIVAGVSPAFALSSHGSCKLRIASGVFGILRAYQSSLDQCIKFGIVGACESNEVFITSARNALKKGLGQGSPCEVALAGGTDPADLVEDHCASAYPHEYWRDCVVWRVSALYAKLRHDLDLPDAPNSGAEQSCIRSANAVLARSVRAAIKSAMSCIKNGGEPPWSCPIDLSLTGKFGRALSVIPVKVSKCRDASGVRGTIGAGLAQMCNRAVVSVDDLSACLRETSICQACLAIEMALDQQSDCAAISGDPFCSLGFTKPRAGSFFVANQGDDSVTYFDESSEYTNGDLESSTFQVAAGPVDIAVSERSNAIFVINGDADSVTALRADDGSYLNGTLIDSTVPVGNAPTKIKINPLLDIVYVLNAGDDSVTFLDARDGSYVYGTLAASTFPVGREPADLELTVLPEMLLVANAGDDTISLLDPWTGQPFYGLISNSTWATGPEPRALATTDWHHVHVANAGDGTVWTVDVRTGVKVRYEGSWSPYPSRDTVPGDVDLVAAGGSVYAGFEQSQLLMAWSPNRADVFSQPTEGSPSDVTIGGGYESAFDAYIYAPLLATIRDRDLVAVVPRRRFGRDLGVTARERSSIATPDFFIRAYDSTRGEYFATDRATSRIVVLDAEDLSVLRQIALDAFDLVLDASAQTLYASTASGVAVVDEVSGEGRYGTIAQSTINCGCSYVSMVAVDSSRDRLYMLCNDHVIYVDTADGSCLGGGAFTSGAGGAALCSLGVDKLHNRLLVSPCSGSIGIFELAPDSPQYLDGTLAGSIFGESAGYSGGSIAVSPDGRVFHAYYRGYASAGIRVYDASAGALLATFSGDYRYAYAFSFDFDLTHDIVRIVRPALVTYLRSSDLTYLGTDAASSTLSILSREGNPGRGFAGVTMHGPAAGSFVGTGQTGMTFMKRDAVEYWHNEPIAAIRERATGSAPSAVAVMPAPRVNWRN